MSSSKFHVNAAGEPGQCSAKINCPFGSSEEHFNTREEAREFYEKSQEATVLPETMSKSELNKAAKTSSDPNVLMHAAINGSDRTRHNLCSNSNVTGQALAAALESSEDETLQLRLQLHDRFPKDKYRQNVFDQMKTWSELSPVKDRVKHNEATRFMLGLASSDELDDAQLQRAEETFGDRLPTGRIVSNPLNKISSMNLVRLAEKNLQNLSLAVTKNYRYPVADRIEHLSPQSVSDVSGYVRDQDAIRKIIDYPKGRSTRQSIIYRLSINSRTPHDVLDKIAKEDKSPEVGKVLYNHPNSTPELKRSLSGRSDELKALGKIDLIREKSPEVMENFKNSIKPLHDVNSPEYKFQIDPDVRKVVGLNNDEIEVYANNHIAPNGTYDHETNVYTVKVKQSGYYTGD